MRSRALALTVFSLAVSMVVAGLSAPTAQAATAAPSQLPGLLIGLKLAKNGLSDTFLEHADGSALHNFSSSGPTGGDQVTWSPDGNWVAFTDGSGEGELSHPDGSAEIPSNAGSGSAFTPDGSRIVFGEPNGLATQLAYTPTTCPTFNPITGQANNCSKPYFTVDTGGNDHNVSISASGIAYFQHDTMANLFTVAFSDIWTDHGTKTPELLIADGTEPAVSPDGTELAFVRQVDGSDEIFVQASDGSGIAVQETSGPGEHRDPSWRPDGTGLFYTFIPAGQDTSGAVGHQLTFSGGTPTDTLVPGSLFAVSQQPLPSKKAYHAYGPKRLLDTRKAVGVPTTTPVPPNGTVTLAVEGAQGIPASGVSAVVLNVTVTQPSGGGFLTAYADGQPVPPTSNLNFGPGQTVANQVTVPVIDGKIGFHNGSGGTVHVVADAFGYYTSSTTDNAFTALPPIRVLDTRNGTGVRQGPIGGNSTVTLKIGSADKVPANATAAVLNLTATQGTAGGYLTAYPTGTPLPTTSNLNFTAGETRANLVVVPLGANGSINIYNRAGQVSAVADLMGYFTPGAGPTFDPGVPSRVLDTRKEVGVPTTTPIAPGATVTLAIPGLPANTTAVVLNVTVTAPSAGGFLTVYPGAGAAPTTSNLNFSPGETVPNLVVVAATGAQVSFRNGSGGTVHVVADLFGAYAS
jgi:hypothetical protein